MNKVRYMGTSSLILRLIFPAIFVMFKNLLYLLECSYCHFDLRSSPG